ncbi:MAG: sugar dehydrogenase complex small subunit [Burkholderiales bacterium]
MHVTRRTTLRALAALAAAPLASPSHAAGAPLSVAAFGTLSATLTGYPVADPDMVGRMMRAFVTPARRAAVSELAQVVAATPPAELDATLRARKLDALANELVAAWYSGVVDTATGTRVVLYANAYVWTAMTYSKPMGVCGGVTGYWSAAPAA